MQRQSKDAVVRRLRFAAAELEVVSGIADSEGETALLEQLHALTERLRECARSVLNGSVRENPQNPTWC
jgi:hypothetical protein